MQSDIFQLDHSFLQLPTSFGHDPIPQPKGRVLSINQLQNGQVRARKVVSRSNSRPTGKYPSWKMQRQVHWESHNELNAFRLLDANPLVLRFHEQPFEILYEIDGEQHRHFPDVLVETRDGKEVWEIKSLQWAVTDKNRSRAALMVAELPRHGFQYRPVVAEDLRKEPRLATVSTLLQWGRQGISAIERERLRISLERKPCVTWGEVLTGALGQHGRRHCSRLVLEGALHIDVNKALTPDTVLTYMAATAQSQIMVEA